MHTHDTLKESTALQRNTRLHQMNRRRATVTTLRHFQDGGSQSVSPLATAMCRKENATPSCQVAGFGPRQGVGTRRTEHVPKIGLKRPATNRGPVFLFTLSSTQQNNHNPHKLRQEMWRFLNNGEKGRERQRDGAGE